MEGVPGGSGKDDANVREDGPSRLLLYLTAERRHMISRPPFSVLVCQTIHPEPATDELSSPNICTATCINSVILR